MFLALKLQIIFQINKIFSNSSSFIMKKCVTLQKIKLINNKMKYLKLPLRLQYATNRKLARCSYEESIAQQIMLLILSHNGEVIGKDGFGSLIWELEFNQLVKISDWEDGVRNSLLQTIKNFEPRLSEVDVNVALSEIEEENRTNISHVRRRAMITVTGKIIKTATPFHFSTSIHISPLSQ